MSLVCDTSTMSNVKQEFLKELKALMEKHNASIEAGVGFGSDTHGIWDEHIDICDHRDKTLLRVQGWSLGHEDIKIEDGI